MKTRKKLIKELTQVKLKLLAHTNPEAYGKRLYKKWRYCRYQGCNDCIRTGGIVQKGHVFAGPLGN